MRTWQKILLMLATIVMISLFIKWWMSYEPMQIVVVNRVNESINVSMIVEGIDKKEYFNRSFVIESNESRVFENITNLAGEYFLKVKADNMSIYKKIKFGKYFEKIEVIITRDGIVIENRRK